MEILIPVLIVFPFVAAAVLSVLRHAKAREIVMYAASVIVMLLAGSLLVLWLQNGAVSVSFYVETELVDGAMLVVELFLMVLVTVLCARRHRYLIALLSIAPVSYTHLMSQ